MGGKEASGEGEIRCHAHPLAQHHPQMMERVGRWWGGGQRQVDSETTRTREGNLHKGRRYPVSLGSTELFVIHEGPQLPSF